MYAHYKVHDEEESEGYRLQPLSHIEYLSESRANGAFPIFSCPRSSLTFSTRSSDQTSPRGFSLLHGEEIESPVQEEQKMSILLLIQLGKAVCEIKLVLFIAVKVTLNIELC